MVSESTRSSSVLMAAHRLRSIGFVLDSIVANKMWMICTSAAVLGENRAD